MFFFLYILFFSLGFAIGRLSHIIFGSRWNCLHHWIYGLVLIFLGWLISPHLWSGPFVSFGLALFVSDLKDFSQFKIHGHDDRRKKRLFWRID